VPTRRRARRSDRDDRAQLAVLELDEDSRSGSRARACGRNRRRAPQRRGTAHEASGRPPSTSTTLPRSGARVELRDERVERLRPASSSTRPSARRAVVLRTVATRASATVSMYSADAPLPPNSAETTRSSLSVHLPSTASKVTTLPRSSGHHARVRAMPGDLHRHHRDLREGAAHARRHRRPAGHAHRPRRRQIPFEPPISRT